MRYVLGNCVLYCAHANFIPPIADADGRDTGVLRTFDDVVELFAPRAVVLSERVPVCPIGGEAGPFTGNYCFGAYTSKSRSAAS